MSKVSMLERAVLQQRYPKEKRLTAVQKICYRAKKNIRVRSLLSQSVNSSVFLAVSRRVVFCSPFFVPRFLF